MPKFNDLTGQTFNRLTVLRLGIKKGRRNTWVCRCQCGNEKTIVGDHLGRILSCGCAKRENEAKGGSCKSHGEFSGGRPSPTASSWQAAKRRCHDPRDLRYDLYGGRGIQMCNRWRNSLAAFVEDMGHRPAGCTLDRVDPQGHYEPANCRWADVTAQARNKRNTAYVTVAGERMCFTEYTERTGLRPGTVWVRLYRSGLSHQEFVDKHQLIPAPDTIQTSV